MALRRRPTPAPAPARGMLLLGLLIALALAGIALLGAVDLWSMTRQREREQQLLFVGDQYRQAIRRYWFAAPAGMPHLLPASLDALLEDDRYPTPTRHLRRLYPDPITGAGEWGLLRDGERITGVYSLSEATPVKQAGFPPAYAAFEGQSRYRDWVFAFVLPRRDATAPSTAPGTGVPGMPPSNPRPTRGNPP